MFRFLLTLGFVISLQLSLFAQTTVDISARITKVTLFTKGAQIESEANASLLVGPMTLKISNLSPYIRKESIKIQGDGSFTILNVQHQHNYLSELEKSKETEFLKNKIDEIKLKIEDEETWIKVYENKLDFLKTNKEINGTQQTIQPETFKTLTAIYSDYIEKLSFDILKKERLIESYNKEIAKLNNQLSSLNSKTDLPSSTILISINAKQAKNSTIEVTYLVNNAEWYPSYDIRFKGIGKPLTVTYKANVSQNTGVDWKNVNLVLSNAKTDISGQVPTLNPFYLQFYTPVIQTLQGKVSGLDVTESEVQTDGSPKVVIRGNRSISPDDSPLYVIDGVQHSNAQSIDPDDIESMEVLKAPNSTGIYGSRGSNGVIIITTKKNKDKSSIPLTSNFKRETSSEFIVNEKQTIVSNGKMNSFVFKESDLEAGFNYKSVPKISENVYLIASITDWYKADFIDGEVNLYLENSYVGKSMINTAQFTDTLEISFGIDNNISIKREKVSEFLKSQIIGLNRKETIAYRLKIRNNKSYSVKTKIYDQIPVSNVKDIEVEALELSNGEINSETSIVKWELELKPNETKELIIKYSVKYPKDKKVLVD